MFDLANLSITVGGLVASGFLCWGIMTAKVDFLEETIKELKQEVKDFRRLSEDLAVVKSKLSTIEELLARIVLESKEHH